MEVGYNENSLNALLIQIQVICHLLLFAKVSQTSVYIINMSFKGTWYSCSVIVCVVWEVPQWNNAYLKDQLFENN